jgi:hypothetical protein
MEEVDIGLADDSFRNNTTTSSSSIPGMELLMNDRRKNPTMSTSLDIDDLNDLETELNDLTKNVRTEFSQGRAAEATPPSTETKFSSSIASFSNFFGLGNNNSSGGSGGANRDQLPDISLEENDSNIGKATANNHTSGMFSFTSTPPPPQEYISATDTKNAERERRRKKRLMLKKLDEWYDKGITRVKFYMDTDYTEIEDEYEACMDEKRRKDSVKLQGWWFMTFVNSIEYGNAIFNPFDLNLDGWGEQFSEDIDSYEEIFTELYQKYKGGKLSPEISLLLRLGFSAAVINLTNKALSTSTPAFNDVIKQSPELMKLFTDATVKTMKTQGQPTAASFVGDVFNSNITNNTTTNSSFGAPPPPPVRVNRPDIAVSRSVNENTPLFKEKGIEIDDKSSNFSFQERARPEMRGPQKRPELNNDLFKGLKMQPPTTMSQSQPSTSSSNVKNIRVEEMNDYETDSVISATSLKELQNNSTVPKRYGKRKNRSDKSNTISLDI